MPDDKLDGVIKHRSSRETTMVGRGPLSTVVSFSARPKVRIHSPPAKSLQTFCSAWRLQELARTLARRREGRSARRRAVGLGLPLVSFAPSGSRPRTLVLRSRLRRSELIPLSFARNSSPAGVAPDFNSLGVFGDWCACLRRGVRSCSPYGRSNRQDADRGRNRRAGGG